MIPDFFRRRIVEILEADARIEVVGTAGDGKEAIEQVAKLKPDVVTMDIEMPVMDGITAVRHIMSSQPVPILMFSSLTHDGAQATLDALEAGAVDFLPKRFEDIAKDREEAKLLLRRRIHAVARQRRIPLACHRACRQKQCEQVVRLRPRRLSSVDSSRWLRLPVLPEVPLRWPRCLPSCRRISVSRSLSYSTCQPVLRRLSLPGLISSALSK